jgi:hypothetical protein
MHCTRGQCQPRSPRLNLLRFSHPAQNQLGSGSRRGERQSQRIRCANRDATVAVVERRADGKNATVNVRRCSGLLRAVVAFYIPVGYAVGLFGDFVSPEAARSTASGGVAQCGDADGCMKGLVCSALCMWCSGG